jgi:hypothetical protein
MITNKSIQYKWLKALKNTDFDKKQFSRGFDYAKLSPHFSRFK